MSSFRDKLRKIFFMQIPPEVEDHEMWIEDQIVALHDKEMNKPKPTCILDCDKCHPK